MGVNTLPHFLSSRMRGPSSPPSDALAPLRRSRAGRLLHKRHYHKIARSAPTNSFPHHGGSLEPTSPLSSRMRGPIFSLPSSPFPHDEGRLQPALAKTGDGGGNSPSLVLADAGTHPLFHPMPSHLSVVPAPVDSYINVITMKIARSAPTNSFHHHEGSLEPTSPLSSRMRGPIFSLPSSPFPHDGGRLEPALAKTGDGGGNSPTSCPRECGDPSPLPSGALAPLRRSRAGRLLH